MNKSTQTNSVASKTSKNLGNNSANSTGNNIATSAKKAFANTSNFSFGGISLPELAVLGAAGFVVWKNREKITSLLESNGMTAPSILSGDVSSLVQSGISMITNKSQDSQIHDA